MKRLYIIVLVLGALSFNGFAQNDCKPKGNWKKELQDFKFKFLAQEIELKEDQKKKFFDLYARMEAEKIKVHDECRQARDVLKKSKNPTEAEYDAVSNAFSSEKLKHAQIEKYYDEKFRTILSAKQLYKLKTAEWKFQKKMMELHGRRNTGKKK